MPTRSVLTLALVLSILAAPPTTQAQPARKASTVGFWRYLVEVQDPRKPADVTGYR